jgi:hypothetical protein
MKAYREINNFIIRHSLDQEENIIEIENSNCNPKNIKIKELN